MIHHVVHMAMMGLFVSVAAPGLLLALARVAPQLDRWSVPAWVALPLFVAMHAAVTVSTAHRPIPELLATAAHVALLLSAILFWAPVLGRRQRLPDGLRAVYLYAAMPLLDLAGVWLIAVGDVTGGLSMIVGMLPMGLAAVVITWRWIVDEERRAVLDEASGLATGHVRPDGGRSI